MLKQQTFLLNMEGIELFVFSFLFELNLGWNQTITEVKFYDRTLLVIQIRF